MTTATTGRPLSGTIWMTGRGPEHRAGRNREPSQDRADDEPDEEVDTRPQATAGNVIEVEPPLPVEADRRHQKADDDRDDRQALERHDLDDRPRRAGCAKAGARFESGRQRINPRIAHSPLPVPNPLATPRTSWSKR